ncbi:hypothetical protein [Roseivivax isoporae]|uniref:HPt domain-containing protein n=1 Tax=Roseivivax isoporae LMG 25204 TaxID=1449351 RepID=X7F4I9_9RHOB|nr:hypothetical protein [Roseivivax isoporae]ETX27633.1 hypothetical protein RISW2_11860 [Roseivivax isoporae LMG 25204]
MEVVTFPAPDEAVRLDAERLRRLCRREDPRHAEEIVCRMMEEVALLLAEIERRWQDEDWMGMHLRLLELDARAETLGMVALSRTGTAVRTCLAGGDAVALSATLARLLRVGERSLMAVWDRQDLMP